jgi:hypothetical protein
MLPNGTHFPLSHTWKFQLRSSLQSSPGFWCHCH